MVKDLHVRANESVHPGAQIPVELLLGCLNRRSKFEIRLESEVRTCHIVELNVDLGLDKSPDRRRAHQTNLDVTRFPARVCSL